MQTATQAGIHGFIVDWENKGKFERQRGFDTQINQNSVADLIRVRENTNRRVICRINQFGPWSVEELETAIAAGADEILLPMVRTPAEVLDCLAVIDERCKLGILIETVEAVANAQHLSELPLARVYVGLNDLGIERNLKNIFLSLIDGTVENIRHHFNMPFGFAGLTLPELGSPIPCRLLMSEMARMNCNFTFLRRSFTRDITGRDMNLEVPRMLAALEAEKQRTAEQVWHDHQELAGYVTRWEEGFRTGAGND